MKFPTYRILLFLVLLLIAHSLYAQKKKPLVSEQRDFSNFTQILAKGISNVYITQGATFDIRVEAPEEMIDKIVIAQTGNQLLVTTDDTKSVVMEKNNGFRKIVQSKVFITVPFIEVIEVAGSADVYAQGTFKQDQIQLIVRGSGDLSLDLDSQEVICKISGAGDLKLTGKAQNLVAEVSGSGDLRAYPFKVKTAQIKVSGAGDARVFATDSLNADVSGSGGLYYDGNPNVTNFNLSGVGSIHQKNK